MNRKIAWPGWVSLALMTFSGISAGQQARPRPLPELDANPKTGPAVGSRIPAFDATDQNGRRQTFETLRGPKGLVLLFVRSADW